MAYIQTSTSAFRSWPVPAKSATWLQDWSDALFLHWPVDPEVVDNLIPRGLKPDILNGKAWISIVAFSMDNVVHKFLPVPQAVSMFDEINVRTYVTDGKHRGVYFLSIQAGKKFASWLSRKASGMPYRFTDMLRKKGEFKSRAYPQRFDCEYEVGSKQEKTDLSIWLTERYGLFRMKRNRLMWQEINHDTWPTFDLDVKHLNVHYPDYGLDGKVGPALCQYSTGVTACIWNPVVAESQKAALDNKHEARMLTHP